MKARAIGIEEDGHEKGDLRDVAGKQQPEHQAQVVHLLGRDVPVMVEERKVRALDHARLPPLGQRWATSSVRSGMTCRLCGLRWSTSRAPWSQRS